MWGMDKALNELMKGLPDAYTDRFTEVVERTDAFCAAHLDDAYKRLCRELAAAACRQELAILSGRPASWAAGVVYAVGRVNFLTDPSQSPHMTSKDLAKGIGVSVSNMQAKSRVLWDGLELMPFHPDWSLPGTMDDNPLVWMLSVNGFVMDIRTAPCEAQVAAYEAGLIPYIPADREAAPDTEAGAQTGAQTGARIVARKDEQTAEAPSGADQADKLFELEVAIIQGPMTEAFLKDNPEIIRTLQVRGDQTLDTFHEAIFDAFDRFDAHMYEFQIGGKGPNDPDAKRYGLVMCDSFDPDNIAGDVRDTTIGSLGLKVDEPFGYWFDFGDDWWHQVTVRAIHDKAPRGRYPKVTERIGDSPPQYPELDE